MSLRKLMLPPMGRPSLDNRDRVKKSMQLYGVDTPEVLTITGIRGFFPNSLGVKRSATHNGNDDDVFDDFVGILYKDDFVTFNATLDAASSTNKHGAPEIAPGLYPAYKLDYHKWEPGRLAVCQRLAPVKVWRKIGKFFEWGYFGVNIHDARTWNTWSNGCTTIPKDNGQYGEFIGTVVEIQKSIYGTSEKNYMAGKINYLVENNY